MALAASLSSSPGVVIQAVAAFSQQHQQLVLLVVEIPLATGWPLEVVRAAGPPR